MVLCVRKAREARVSIEDLVWAVIRGLIAKGARGDAAAGKLVLDRLCGVIDKGPTVNVDARSVTVSGPPVPRGRDLAKYILDLQEVARRQGILDVDVNGRGLVEVVDAAAEDLTDNADEELGLEDLLG